MRFYAIASVNWFLLKKRQLHTATTVLKNVSTVFEFTIKCYEIHGFLSINQCFEDYSWTYMSRKNVKCCTENF